MSTYGLHPDPDLGKKLYSDLSVHFFQTETQPTTETKNKNGSQTYTIFEAGKTLKIAVKTAA